MNVPGDNQQDSKSHQEKRSRQDLMVELASLKRENLELRSAIAASQSPAEAPMASFRADESLAQTHVATILDAMPSAVVITNAADGRYSFVNRRAQELYGVNFLGIPLDAHFSQAKVLKMDGSDFPLAELPVSHTLKNGAIVRNVEMIFQCPDGQQLTILASSAPLYDAEGNITAAVASFLDITQRRQNEKEIEFQAHLLESVSDAIVATDENFRLTYWNWQAENLFGWSGSEALGRTTQELLHPILPERSRDAAVANLLQNDFYFGEVTYRHKDGTPIQVENRARLIRDEAGRIKESVTTIRDIRTRKQTEFALRQSEEKYQNLVKHAPAGIYEVDYRTRKAIAVNDAMADLTGYSRDELLTMNPLDLLAGESRDLAVARVQQWLEGIAPSQFVDYKLRRKDGREIYVAMSATYMTDETGKPHGAMLILHDVTERKKIEEALRERDLLLRTLVSSAPEMLFIKDRDSRVVLLNDAYGKTFGVDVQSLIGKSDLEIYGDNDPAYQSMKNDQRVMRSGETEIFEETADTTEGPAVFLISKSPWRNEHGEIIGVVGSGINITERKKLEAQLRQLAEDLATANRNKSQFLNMLSHELRNPLAAIVASLDLLTHIHAGNEKALRATRVLKRQAGHLTQLVDDLLDVTRITTNKIQLKREPVNLVELIRRTISDFKPLYAEKSVALNKDLLNGSIMLQADSVRLVQAFSNLLHNALKFTPSGGRVDVSSRIDNVRREAIVMIKDNGFGIAPDVMAKLFEPFSQGEQSLARTQGGLGLGLSIVKGMVELHGGHVSAESAGIGQGAAFTIRLPLCP